MGAGDIQVVVDRALGLMWELGDSASTTDRLRVRDDAAAYARQLNAAHRGGFSDWRLPTLEEAMSLATDDGKLQEVLGGDGITTVTIHLDPVFQGGFAPFIWTADFYTDDDPSSAAALSLGIASQGWVVLFVEADAVARPLTSFAYVRAVRSL